jgi:hypothetical protein
MPGCDQDRTPSGANVDRGRVALQDRRAELLVEVPVQRRQAIGPVARVLAEQPVGLLGAGLGGRRLGDALVELVQLVAQSLEVGLLDLGQVAVLLGRRIGDGPGLSSDRRTPLAKFIE